MKIEIGKKYKVVKPETKELYHCFSVGDVVTCSGFEREEVWDFTRDSDGVEQALYPSYFVPFEEGEYTGGSSSYYVVDITDPTTLEEGYTAECNDIIEALDMNFAEGNIFKAVWRRAASRLGKKKAGHNEDYDAEKILFFAKRLNGMKAE